MKGKIEIKLLSPLLTVVGKMVMLMSNSSVIISLCSNLGGKKEVKPLTIAEWGRVAECLLRVKRQPLDLLVMSGSECLELFGPRLAGNDRLQRLLGRSGSLAFELAEYEKYGIHIVTRADGAYPTKLKAKLGEKCPPLFYYIGNLHLLDEDCIGFAGSRNIGENDEGFARKAACRCVDNGFSIVSGGARGIDSVASMGSLEYGGQAIEFLADSMLKRLRNAELYKKIEEECLLMLSYVHPKAPFNVGNAMERNKFVYTQAQATVVVKSDLQKGGTWAGATEGLKHKWGVLCWDNKDYLGNQELIKLGAEPIAEGWGGPLKQYPTQFMVCEPESCEQLQLFE